MVHNLRSRNICGTSNKVKDNARQTNELQDTPLTALDNLRDGRLHEIRTIQMQSISQCRSTEIHDDKERQRNELQDTPLTAFQDNPSILTQLSRQSESSTQQIECITETFSSSEEMRGVRENQKNNSSHFENFRLQLNSDALCSTRLNVHTSYSSYQSNICVAVDEAIFKKTYNKRKGISLHAVRQGIEEFGYKPYSTRKAFVCSYVRENIRNGELVQITGHGAAGTFRHNKTVHHTFLRGHKENKIHKSRNVTATCLKRFKNHDLELYETMKNNTLTQRKAKH